MILNKIIPLLIISVFYLFNITEIISLNQIIYSERFGVSDVFGSLGNIKEYLEYLTINNKKIVFFYYSVDGNLQLINPIIALNKLLFNNDFIKIYKFSFLLINFINLFTLYILFYYFFKNRYISLIISLVFCFNPEFELRLYKGHINLYMYFIPILIILFLEIIIKDRKNYAFISLILLLLISSIYTQYYFYFSIVYILIRKIVYLSFNLKTFRYRDYKKHFIFFIIFMILFFSIYVFVIIPTNIFEQINIDKNRINLMSYINYSVKNPIEYFISIPNKFEYEFSYFLLNGIETTRDMLIQNKENILLYGLNTGEFNHRIGLIIPFIITYYFIANKSIISQDKELLITSVAVFVLTMIPVSLMLYIVPYFRVVSRLIIFTDILIFILLGKALIYLFDIKKIKSLYYLLLIILPFSINFEFYKEKQKTIIYRDEIL